MKNIAELREELAKVFSDLRAGGTDCKTAAELSNIAGKMIGTVKVELDSAALRKEAPDIEFLKY